MTGEEFMRRTDEEVRAIFLNAIMGPAKTIIVAKTMIDDILNPTDEAEEKEMFTVSPGVYVCDDNGFPIEDKEMPCETQPTESTIKMGSMLVPSYSGTGELCINNGGTTTLRIRDDAVLHTHNHIMPSPITKDPIKESEFTLEGTDLVFDSVSISRDSITVYLIEDSDFKVQKWLASNESAVTRATFKQTLDGKTFTQHYRLKVRDFHVHMIDCQVEIEFTRVRN